MAIEDVEWLDRFGDQSYKQRSKWAILFILASLSFSLAIVYPSLPQVLLTFDASMSSLGHAIALPFIMELASMPLYSVWYNSRPIKEPVIAGLLLSALGSLIYANAATSIHVIAARSLIGLGSGFQLPLIVCSSSLMSRENMVRAYAHQSFMHLLGFLLASGVAAIFHLGPSWVGGIASGLQPKEISYYAAVAAVMSICVAVTWLQEPANKLTVPLFPGDLLSASKRHMLFPLTAIVLIVALCNSVEMMAVSVFPVYTMSFFRWSPGNAAMLLMVAVASGVTGAAVRPILVKLLPRRTLLLASMFIVACAAALETPWGHHPSAAALTIGAIIMAGGLYFSAALGWDMFIEGMSRVFPEHTQPFYSVLLFLAGHFPARIITPLLTSYLHLNVAPEADFYLFGVFAIVCALWLVWLRKELIGPEIEDPVLPLADPSEIMGRRLFGDSLGVDGPASDRFYSPGYASFTSSTSAGQRGYGGGTLYASD